jgi:hypothetical protein
MKQTKWFRGLMKIWIAMVSVIVFFGGWIIFGHTGKPVEAQGAQPAGNGQQLAPLPTLAPLPDLSSGASLQPLPAQQQPSFQFSMPRMRTRGS